MQEADILFKKWFGWIRRKKDRKLVTIQEPIRKENPFLPMLRNILEQVLEQKGLSYGSMKLLLIDTDEPSSSMLDEDDVQMALNQLSQDLNFLIILTDRPTYFQQYVETMYEETGLPVQIGKKGSARENTVNMVLDFEQKGDFWKEWLTTLTIYVPIYKKKWETAENLDICVPIGYNTVIVKNKQ